MIWAEITGKCQLSCSHCYAGSGPGGTHGTMTPEDWQNLITQAAELGARHITFIGGEPTLHPDLPRLARHALALGLNAEIYSNLVHVTAETWELLELPGVSLAASWYTDDRAQHAAITGRDTWRQTRANFAEAARRGIPVRAGMVDGIIPGQRAANGERKLRALGVADIGRDHAREFGRGTLAAPGQACGQCGQGRAAVLPDGTVTPCPMTRWITAGSVRDTRLGTIIESMASMTATLPARDAASCNPDDCRPDTYCAPLCTPSACKPIIRSTRVERQR
jgi:MoaA/NifB/PqqE/SkfB family radical SAM enzyme